MTIHERLKRLRVENAREMIRDPDRKAIEAATSCGSGSVWALDFIL